MKYIILFVSLTIALGVHAEKNERDYLRSGNRLFSDSLYVKAEVDYRKAIEINPKSGEAVYNLANTLLMQQKIKEALEQYEIAARIETNKIKLAKIYHNMGVLLQAGKQYPQCIEAYKQSLRNNPKDDETRYNLALAQHMLQQQNNDQQNQEQKQNQEENQDNKQQNNEQKDDKQQQQDPPKPQNPEEQNEDKMSKENAQQLLNAVMRDEKNVQEKVKKQLQLNGKKNEKDW